MKPGSLFLALATTLAAACGGQRQPAPTPVAPVSASVPAASAPAPVPSASATGSVDPAIDPPSSAEGSEAEPPESTSARGPRAVLGAILVQGELPAAVVLRIARQRTPGFRSCYVERLKKRPHLTGVVVVHFVIDASGDLSESINIEQDMGEEDLAQCVRNVVKTIIFPQPNHGTVSVDLPILFAP